MLLTKILKDLLKGLYLIFINTDHIVYWDNYNYDVEDKLFDYINNFLFEHEVDPKKLLDVLTNDSKYFIRYASLIGFFYHKGIGCKVDKMKSYEIFSNLIKNYQKEGTIDDETITFCDDDDDDDNNDDDRYSDDDDDDDNDDDDGDNDCFDRDYDDYDDIKKLNKIISKYFYSLFLYKDVMIYRKDNYKLHIKNAEKGDAASQHFIGNYYYVNRDYNKAIEWYSKSSSGGNIKATYMLGNCYYDNDKKKAFELYLKSAKGGYNIASFMVGNCYHYGNGIIKDEYKAFKWYLKSAKKGYNYCQFIVSNYYNDGICVKKNEEKGFYWNRKAAINGYIYAQHKLANYYFDDTFNKNERKALKWYLELSKKNSFDAISLVSKCYRDGIGTQRNFNEAIKWFEKTLYFY
ncbi:hypothetical protein RclHR1_15920003 [Rhizophagus clarus]|uniref:Sel1-like repeat protein n=1 Tax=Rhizophagus clarus TaxID=94130 RepID=A0A2Z6QWX3_9GLOM|nr:hypothetical protein RclHR1_15920003 [Rhizophagus clarus]GET04122.1 Sel1-like repeat protein [Rhizophagus clarus]